MRRTLVALTIVSSLGVAAPRLHAQTPPAGAAQEGHANAFIEPWIGLHFTGGVTDAFKDQDTKTRSYGVTLGFLQRGWVGGELEFGYSPDYFSDGNSSIVGGNNLLTLTGSMMIGPWIKGFRPYVVVGGGLARSKIEDFVKFGSDVQNRGVIDYGGGVNLFFTRHFGIRGDVRIMRDVGSQSACASGDILCDVTGWGVTNDVYRRMHVGVLIGF